MYEARLGAERMQGLNPFRGFADAGVPLLLGSDSPVCPVDPWEGVRAAVHHRTPAHSLTIEEAFAAHTTGPLTPGAPATFAVWSHDGRETLGESVPDCLRLVVRGREVFARV
jgi:predicted amidohydrolase YtcJ